MSTNPAIAKPSDLGQPFSRPAVGAAAGGEATSPDRTRALPPPMELSLKGGETVELLADQTFADGRTIRSGRQGVALYPSSQAACWVVYFKDEDEGRRSRMRVLPENLLRAVSPRSRSSRSPRRPA